MPPRNRKSKDKYLMEFIALCIFIVVGYLYQEWIFPNQYRDLYPQKFQSHQLNDISSQARNWSLMYTLKFNNSLASQCQDIQISSKELIYCINENNTIIEINVNKEKIRKLYQIKGIEKSKNRSYGLKLSRNQKLLYFAHSQLGLCQFDLKKKKLTKLVSEYEGKPLISLNSIQTHPTKPNILYLTQTSNRIPLKLFSIEFLMNQPNGRVFKFDKLTNKLTLLADGLYFANGIVFQEYNKQETVLVAQSNRFRLTRIWVSGANQGRKQIAVDKLDVYLDNMKTNQNGEIWIAGPSMRNYFLYFADYHPIIRYILSRAPPQIIQKLAQNKIFGGVKLKFHNKNKNYKAEYFLWEKIEGWKFTTTISEKNDRLFLSSLKSKGILVVNDLTESLKSSYVKQQSQNDL